MTMDAASPSAPEPPDPASREPWLAATWGAVFPGLGQAYVGDVGAAWAWGGVIVLTTAACVAFFFLPGWPVWPGYLLAAAVVALAVGSLVHAHARARRTRSPEAEAARTSQRDAWKVVFLNLLFPGVGQLYDKRWLAGLSFLVLSIGVSAAPPAIDRFLGEAIAVVAILEAWSGTPSRKGTPDLEVRRVVGVRIALLALALITTVGVRATLVRAARIPSVSMQPTLRAGDYFLIDVTRRGRADRDDLVAFSPPGDPKHEFVKRVLGVGGDDVEIRDDGAWRNAERVLPGPGFAPGALRETPGTNGTPYGVPPGTVYVVGDWLENSQDSRHFGPIPLASIHGRAYKIYWPPNRAGTIAPASATEGLVARTAQRP